MAFDYINEAFKKLDLLNEEMFNSSTDGINHLTDYMRDEESSEDTIRVIDPDATDEEELQDSYIGKLIVNCNVCHSHIFMNKEDVELDEEGYATSDDCCPYCGEQEGFVIVGEIAPANVKDDSSEASETEQDTEFEDKEVDESLTEDFKEVSIKTDDQHLAMTSDENGKVTVVTEPLNSSSQEEIDAETVEEGAISDETIVPVSDETTNEIVDKETIPEDEVESPSEEETSLSDEDAASDTEEESTETEDTAADEDTTDDEMVEESYFSSNRDNNLNELFGFGGKKVKVYVAPKCYTSSSLNTSTFGNLIHGCLSKIVLKELSGKVDKIKPLNEYEFVEKFPEAKKQFVKSGYTFICKEKKLMDIKQLIYRDFKDKLINAAKYGRGESEITPQQMKLIGNFSNPDFVQITTEVLKESLNSTKSDIYFESVDEDQLNSLTESYLKNVYENVSSFKTTNVGADDSHLVVEGVITFASGKQKNTKFIFESKDINHKGQLRFSGHNKSLSESIDCYSLVGTLDNSKLFLESLKYDYTTQNTRVRGVVRRK
jgi:hypothetical protein